MCSTGGASIDTSRPYSGKSRAAWSRYWGQPLSASLAAQGLGCLQVLFIADRRRGLVADARLRLLREGGGTTAEMAWTLKVLLPALRLASRIGRPLLQWGHDCVLG